MATTVWGKLFLIQGQKKASVPKHRGHEVEQERERETDTDANPGRGRSSHKQRETKRERQRERESARETGREEKSTSLCSPVEAVRK